MIISQTICQQLFNKSKTAKKQLQYLKDHSMTTLGQVGQVGKLKDNFRTTQQQFQVTPRKNSRITEMQNK